MQKTDRLKTFIDKTSNFSKRIKYATERLEKRIIEGRAKYFLEPIPGIGHYFWSRSMGESKDLSIGGAVIEGIVRSVPIAVAVVTGDPSCAIVSEGFFDTAYESSTFLKYRKPKIRPQKTIEENWEKSWKQKDVTYG